jgi:predicted DNA-binding transcriptional regulator AlpA
MTPPEIGWQMPKQFPLKESPRAQVALAKKAATLKGSTKPLLSPQLIAANQDHIAEAALAADCPRDQHDRQHVYGARGPPADALPLDDLILRAERKRLVPLSDATIWRMERRGEFPRRIVISSKRVAWRRSEIER